MLLEFVRVPPLTAERLLILYGFAYHNELRPYRTPKQKAAL